MTVLAMTCLDPESLHGQILYCHHGKVELGSRHGHQRKVPERILRDDRKMHVVRDLGEMNQQSNALRAVSSWVAAALGLARAMQIGIVRRRCAPWKLLLPALLVLAVAPLAPQVWVQFQQQILLALAQGLNWPEAPLPPA